MILADNTEVRLAPGSSRTTVRAVAAGVTATFVSAGRRGAVDHSLVAQATPSSLIGLGGA